MADVVLKSLNKRFGETHAVRDLNLCIRDGEFVVLLGPTGAGKTTTLRLIAGLEKARQRPDRPSAAATLQGEAPAERDVAFVFQQYSLYPHMTVYENLAFPADGAGAQAERAKISTGASARSPGWSGSTTSSKTVRRSCRAARCSASPSAGRLVRRPANLSDGRAAVVARCQAAGRASAGTETHPEGTRLDPALCHPRPGRGHDHGRPHRHLCGRKAAADRHARAKSTAIPPTSMSPHASASRTSISCPRGFFPAAGRRRARGRSAHAPSIWTSRRCDRQRQCANRLDRASGRPEPPAYPGSATTSSSRLPILISPVRPGDEIGLTLKDPLYFDAERAAPG